MLEAAILVAAVLITWPLHKVVHVLTSLRGEISGIRSALASALFWRDSEISNIYLLEQHLGKISEAAQRADRLLLEANGRRFFAKMRADLMRQMIHPDKPTAPAKPPESAAE